MTTFTCAICFSLLSACTPEPRETETTGNQAWCGRKEIDAWFPAANARWRRVRTTLRSRHAEAAIPSDLAPRPSKKHTTHTHNKNWGGDFMAAQAADPQRADGLRPRARMGAGVGTPAALGDRNRGLERTSNGRETGEPQRAIPPTHADTQSSRGLQ